MPCEKLEKFVASPLNYIGGKYKLLSQIIPLFPKNISTFVDLFCGGCNVGINVAAKKVICNDIDSKLIGLLKFFKLCDYEELNKKIYSIIEKYNLSDTSQKGYKYYNCNSSDGLAKYNKENYKKLRDFFNSIKCISAEYWECLYVLIVYSFNNQIRFNSSGEFNLPVGKRDYNKKMQYKLKNFLSKIRNINFENYSFDDIRFSQINDTGIFVYADPPYLISRALYNENGGWNEAKEESLLKYLNFLNENGIRFALSNILVDNGKTNNILLEWLNAHRSEYICHHLNKSYINASYQKKIISNQTDEVLIVNY